MNVSKDAHLITFKGLPGCDKTTLSRVLGQSLGWPVVSLVIFWTNALEQGTVTE